MSFQWGNDTSVYIYRTHSEYCFYDCTSFFCLYNTRLNIAECRLMNCLSSFGNARALHVCMLHFSHTGVCGARARCIVDCYPSTGLRKQSSSQQTRAITPDTSVFSIDCHPRHSALSIQHFNTVFLHFHTVFYNPADRSLFQSCFF